MLATQIWQQKYLWQLKKMTIETLVTKKLMAIKEFVVTKKGGDWNFGDRKFMAIERDDNQKRWWPKTLNYGNQMLIWITTRCMTTEMGPISIALIILAQSKMGFDLGWP